LLPALSEGNVRASGEGNVDALDMPPPAKGAFTGIVGELEVTNISTEVISAIFKGGKLGE
jgi:hypothetical protein